MEPNTNAMSVKSKTVIGIVVLVIVVAVVYLYKSKNTETPSSETATTTPMNVSSNTQAPKTTTSKAPVSNSKTTVSSGKPTSETASSTVLSGVVSVSIEGNAFTPANLKVKKGTKVTWTNKDTISHTVTGEQNMGPGSGDLIVGQSYSYVFDKVGEYPYFCQHHTFMRGFVEVVE